VIRLNDNDSVFVLTGAGISAESGIPTFRGNGGMWNNIPFEQVASIDAWRRDPALVWEFYSWRRDVAEPCKPNPAHIALAEWQGKLRDRLFLCTQNVDSLHEQAGSMDVIHIHGHLFRSRCERCDSPAFEDARRYPTADLIPRCECGAQIRPDICWFGEIPFHLDRIFTEAQHRTVMLAIGTSGHVEPAASLVSLLKRKPGARAYYIGLEEPANAHAFDEVFLGRAGELLPRLLRLPQ
jgi:NAD-dependent deacetylase